MLEAVTAAAAECVTNGARHSGQQRVRVHGFVHPHRAHVTVHDHGRGFEATAARRRSGLRTSVTDRMRSVGGTARVDSAPGWGTTVVLEWRADADRGEPLLLWPARTFAPMVAMGAAIATLNIALGLDRPVPFAWAPTPYVVAAGLIVAGLATVVLPVRSRWWFAWLAVMVTAPAAIAAPSAGPAGPATVAIPETPETPETPAARQPSARSPPTTSRCSSPSPRRPRGPPERRVTAGR